MLVVVTLVGPLLALFIKEEENCLFLLSEIVVKVSTSKQLAQIEEVFLFTGFNELKQKKRNQTGL